MVGLRSLVEVREAVSALTSVEDVVYGPISPDHYVLCTPYAVIDFIHARETNWHWRIPNLKRALCITDEEEFKLECARHVGLHGSGLCHFMEDGNVGVEATAVLMEGISMLDR